MPKAATNLSVDSVVMERAKSYGERHGTSVSQLVGDFLANLPSDDSPLDLSPTVASLYGIAKRSSGESSDALIRDPIEAYHE